MERLVVEKEPARAGASHVLSHIILATTLEMDNSVPALHKRVLAQGHSGNLHEGSTLNPEL